MAAGTDGARGDTANTTHQRRVVSYAGPVYRDTCHTSVIPGTVLGTRLTFFFMYTSISSGGWGKIKLKLATLPRIFMHVYWWLVFLRSPHQG